MGFDPIVRTPMVSASIAERLLDRIRSNSLRVGDRLPSETELAKEFGVSRPSVREALAALQFTGHVESRRGFGTVVRDATQTGALRARRRPLHTIGEAVDLLETRLLLEPYAAAAAAVDPDLTALAAAGELITGMRLAVAEPELHASTDIRVHRALLAVCRNTMLRDCASELLDRALDPVLLVARTKAWSSPQLVNDWAEHHRTVWEAIRDGNPEGARVGTITHLASVVDNVAAAAAGDPALERRVALLLGNGGVRPENADHQDGATVHILDGRADRG